MLETPYLSYELTVARKVKKFLSLVTTQNIQSPPLESVCHLVLSISTHPTCITSMLVVSYDISLGHERSPWTEE
jgi:hypothetical protein